MNGDYDILIRDTLAFWSDYVARAEVVIDGVVHDYPIFKKVTEGNRIRFLIYVTGNKGKITDVVVYNKEGEPIRSLVSRLEKGSDGLMIVLSWTLDVREELKL